MKSDYSRCVYLVAVIALVAVSACTATVENATSEPSFTPTSSKPTSTPTLSEPTESPTSTAIATATLIPTTPAPLISSLAWETARPMVLVTTNSNETTLLNIVDLESEASKAISFADEIVHQRVDWVSEICELIVVLQRNGQARLVFVDLTGKIVQEILTTQNTANRHISVVDAVLQPSRDQIAYPVFVTDEIESANVEVASIENREDHQTLTERGGVCVDKRNVVCAIAWSPNGEQLAYSEYDPQRTKQIYVSKPDGADRIQLTDFSEPVEIYQPQWSPDGQRIAIPYGKDPESPTYIQVISLVDRQGVEFPYQLRLENEFWWFGDSELGMYATVPEGQSGSTKIVYWLDAISGQILHSLAEEDSPDGSIIQPKNIRNEEWIGFFSSTPSGFRFFVYDPQTGSFEPQRALNGLEAIYWTPLPKNSADPNGCNP